MASVKDMLQQLEDGVREMFSSGKYQEYLRFYSKMHQYSLRNTMLILSQYPDAEAVASYRTWKSLGINVKKGAKGIKVLVPIPYKKKESDAEETDGVWFKIGNVFDISQTDGSAPQLSKDLIMESKDLDLLVDRLMKEWDARFDFSLLGEECKGKCSKISGISLRPNMSSVQNLKTLIHERAHQILHLDSTIDRETAELEAESVAFIVCGRLGLETGDYSFGYVVGWAADKSLEILKKSLARIEQCSRKVLQEIDTRKENVA